MEKFTISRNDDHYECFPDVTLTRKGRLVLVYRESDSHTAENYCNLIVRTSDDEGKTWSERLVLVETKITDGVLEKWNCPRVVTLKSGKPLIVCDHYKKPPGEIPGSHSINAFWESDDDGSNWSGPRDTTVTGIVPDRPLELPSGMMLLASSERRTDSRELVQLVHRSHDGGSTWEGPIIIADVPGTNPCEGSIALLGDGSLVCYMRENSLKGWAGPKAFSTDEGKTWDGPYDSIIDGCHRPVSGVLKSGNFLTTYRHMPWTGKWWSKNSFAMLEPMESVLAKDRADQMGIILPLDHDRSHKSDSSYTGWVQLPDESIFMVNYINDDAPMAQIRGYRFTEDEF